MASPGAGGLKQTYSWQLRSFVLLNAALFVMVLNGEALASATTLRDWGSLLDSKTLLGLFLPLATLLLDGLVTAEAKAVLVFWRLKHPLPGSTAFSVHGPADSRVDMAALSDKFGPLPTQPEGQNQLWYSLSKRVADRSSVSQAHRSFLLTRDLTSLSLMLLFGLAIAAILLVESRRDAFVYAFVLLTQYLLLRQVAVNHGRRFVGTVLAEAATLGVEG